jgi:hypothetical protein
MLERRRTPMVTLREHLEAIRAAATTGVIRNRAQAADTLNHAVAALEILDREELDMFDEETGPVRLVPAPQGTGGIKP